MGPFDAIMYPAVGAVVTTLLIVGVVASIAAQRAGVDPVLRLLAAGQRFERGELGVRIGNLGGAAEFRVLGRNFDAATGRIEALVRALRLLSAGNRALVHARDEQSLLEDVCRVAVEAGGYHSAQVVYRHEDGMRVMARAGDDLGFTAVLEQHWSQARAAQTPTPGAIFRGVTLVLNDTRTSPVPALTEVAVNLGLGAVIGLPLRVDGEVIGALTIYSAESGVFGPQEVELLEETAADLAFGIATLRLAQRHRAVDARVRQMAYEDPVTGLPNLGRTQAEIARRENNAEPVAVVVVNLINHWEVLATLGPARADALLRAVTDRLAALAPGFLARIGQSEFAVLAADGTLAGAQDFARRALHAIAEPLSLAPVTVLLQAGAGIAARIPPHPVAAGEESQLLQMARLAAHEAQDSASGWRVAGAEMEHQRTERLHLAAGLHKALGTAAFELYVQPQINIATRQPCGMEALARWHDPLYGAQPPARFIAVAEATGLIRALTWRVVELALALVRDYAASGLALPLAVNLSAQNLQDPDLVPRMRDLLAASGLPPGRLHLELTETAVMHDRRAGRVALEGLRDLGLALYMDDFGTGQSSLAYLRELPLSGIKLDRAFTASLGNPSSARIIGAVVDIAHALGLHVIAEGVENLDQLAALAELGCDAAQGYALARPMPGGDLPGWIAGWPRTQA